MDGLPHLYDAETSDQTTRGECPTWRAIAYGCGLWVALVFVAALTAGLGWRVFRWSAGMGE